uniref:Secreted protein n=1 Tax=Solanum lycopersicum TaxID=4081 RepID=K4AUV4_SOLLC
MVYVILSMLTVFSILKICIQFSEPKFVEIRRGMLCNAKHSSCAFYRMVENSSLARLFFIRRCIFCTFFICHLVEYYLSSGCAKCHRLFFLSVTTDKPIIKIIFKVVEVIKYRTKTSI